MKVKIKINNQRGMYSDKELEELILREFADGFHLTRPDKDDGFLSFIIKTLEVECYGLGG
jgi:hypothetical protein